jgi:hypothetical protein
MRSIGVISMLLSLLYTGSYGAENDDVWVAIRVTDPRIAGFNPEYIGLIGKEQYDRILRGDETLKMFTIKEACWWNKSGNGFDAVSNNIYTGTASMRRDSVFRIDLLRGDPRQLIPKQPDSIPSPSESPQSKF